MLFASIASGSPLSFVLANFAQLPIMMAAIGWTHLAGLLAALVASAGLAVVHDRIGRVRVPARHRTAGLVDRLSGAAGAARRRRPIPPSVEWYPVGRIVVWTAIAAALVVVVTMLRYGFDAAQMQAGLRRELERALRFLSGAPANSPLRLPSVKRSRAAARYPGADRPADEGGRADRDQPAQSLARRR